MIKKILFLNRISLLNDFSNIYVAYKEDNGTFIDYDILDNNGNVIKDNIYSKEIDDYIPFIFNKEDAYKNIRKYGWAMFAFIDKKTLNDEDSFEYLLSALSFYIKEKTNMKDYYNEKINLMPYIESVLVYLTYIFLINGVENAVNIIDKYQKTNISLICNFTPPTSFDNHLKLVSKDNDATLELLYLIGQSYKDYYMVYNY